MNSTTIDGVSRELLEEALAIAVANCFGHAEHITKLRAVLDAPVVELQGASNLARFDFENDEACTYIRFGEQKDGAYARYTDAAAMLTELQATIERLTDALESIVNHPSVGRRAQANAFGMRETARKALEGLKP